MRDNNYRFYICIGLLPVLLSIIINILFSGFIFSHTNRRSEFTKDMKYNNTTTTSDTAPTDIASSIAEHINGSEVNKDNNILVGLSRQNVLNLIGTNNLHKINSDIEPWVRLLSMTGVIFISILSMSALICAIIKCNTLYSKELTSIFIQIEDDRSNYNHIHHNNGQNSDNNG